MPGWPHFTHHLSPPQTCWKILDKDVILPKFNVNVYKR